MGYLWQLVSVESPCGETNFVDIWADYDGWGWRKLGRKARSLEKIGPLYQEAVLFVYP